MAWVVLLEEKEKRLLSRLDEQKDTIVELAKSLIKVPTVNPPGKDYLKVVDVIKEWCEAFGLMMEVHDVPQNVVNELPESEGLPRRILIARIDGQRRWPELHYNGHYDVVPPTGKWKVCDPFSPIVKGGRLYGRGASDMKGGLASMLCAISVLKDYVDELEGSVSFSATPDEEVGGATGVGYMLEHSLIKPSCCVIGEPSGILNIWDSHKGQLWAEVRVKGRASHGASPWLGVNAFERASRLASCLFDSYLPMLKARKTSRPTLPPEAGAPTVNIGGVVRGGAKINIVPDSLIFSIDRRLIPEETVSSVKQELELIINKCAKKNGIPLEDVEVRYVYEYDPCLPKDPNFALSLASVVEDVVGKRPNIILCNAGLDMRYFINSGVPCVTYGPGAIGQPHADDEYVDIEDLLATAKVYSIFAYRTLKKTS